jgi:hypothetical protein
MILGEDLGRVYKKNLMIVLPYLYILQHFVYTTLFSLLINSMRRRFQNLGKNLQVTDNKGYHVFDVIKNIIY